MKINQKKINNFENISLKEQKEIILIVLSKSIDKSEGLKKLYELVDSINVNIEEKIDFIKKEFLKIYTFLMEAVDYVNSKKIKQSFDSLNNLKQSLKEMREKEKKEINNENIDYLLEKELVNL